MRSVVLIIILIGSLFFWNTRNNAWLFSLLTGIFVMILLVFSWFIFIDDLCFPVKYTCTEVVHFLCQANSIFLKVKEYHEGLQYRSTKNISVVCFPVGPILLCFNGIYPRLVLFILFYKYLALEPFLVIQQRFGIEEWRNFKLKDRSQAEPYWWKC